MFRITSSQWEKLKSELHYPCKTVVIRAKVECKEYTEGKKDNCLKEDNALIQSRLEKKLETAQKEKEALLQENRKLHHRIAFLEEHLRDLQFVLKEGNETHYWT